MRVDIACLHLVVQLGKSPLWIASQEGHVPVVRLLLESGANASQANEVTCVQQALILVPTNEE